MKVRFACVGALIASGWWGQVHGAGSDGSLHEARSLLAHANSAGKLEEDRLIALAVEIAGGCPATVDAELDATLRTERKQTIAALIDSVAGSGSRRGLTKLLRLASCGISSPSWNREQILERAMARMIEGVPCLPPLSGDVAAERKQLSDFPVLRLRKATVHAELPTPTELDDLAYFMVAVTDAGEEVGLRDRGASWRGKAPSSPTRDRLFARLAAAKDGGNVVEIERGARAYLETLGFPDKLHGAEEEVFFRQIPRYEHVLRDLAESWEALGRFHDAAGLWRRTGQRDAPSEADTLYVWQERVKAVIRDEEIDGRCDVAVAERLLDVGGSPSGHDNPYGPKRLVDARFDVPRLLRGALLTINRDAGEAAVTKAIDALPATTRLLAQMRLRDKGIEDWERRLQAMRGLADAMQEAAVPLLLRAAEQSLPRGRQRALSALGDLAERPTFDPCGSMIGGITHGASDWNRPLRPLGRSCETNLSKVARDELARQLLAYARDPDAGTREAAAVALGKIAAPAARPALRRLLQDGERRGTVCVEATSDSHEQFLPRYPVREAARSALSNITELERNWIKSR
jgi:hypothetical protein